MKQKPGLQFEGRIQELAKKYKDLDLIWMHMTLGQIYNYYEYDGCIIRHKDDKTVYDSKTGETFE